MTRIVPVCASAQTGAPVGLWITSGFVAHRLLIDEIRSDQISTQTADAIVALVVVGAELRQEPRRPSLMLLSLQLNPPHFHKEADTCCFRAARKLVSTLDGVELGFLFFSIKIDTFANLIFFREKVRNLSKSRPDALQLRSKY